jgi:hypothetical protein
MAETTQNNIGALPPLPLSAVGDEFANAIPKTIRDTARYLRLPDQDFARPYISVPGGPTFVWPLGIEGFELQDAAELGIHKYIGDIQLDVEVTHRNQATLVLSGIFPGHTSVKNMQALRLVFQAEQPPTGKILHVPGVLAQAQFIACQSLTSSHAEDERSQDITYSLTVIRVGTGTDVPGSAPIVTAPTGTPKPSASGSRSFHATATVNTLRKIAAKLYGDAAKWTMLYSNATNATWFTKRKIPTHKIPDYRLPIGTVVHY